MAAGASAWITIAAERRGRGDAERHQRALARRQIGLRIGRGQHLAVLQHMVRGHDEHHRVLAAAHGAQRGGGDGRRGVAGVRLQDQLGILDAQLLRLFGRDVAVGFVAHQRGVRLGAGRIQPQQGVLQQAAVIGQTDELLGQQLARQRPQPRARSAAEDDGAVGEDWSWRVLEVGGCRDARQGRRRWRRATASGSRDAARAAGWPDPAPARPRRPARCNGWSG